MIENPDDTRFVDGHLEPTEDFPWELVDPKDRPTVESEIRKEAALAIAKFAKRLLELGGRNKNQFFIAANCFAFAAGLHPAMSNSGESIARKLGITKSAFFNRVNQCRDVLKLPRIKGVSRTEEARKIFKRTATQAHEKHKRKPANSNRVFLDRIKAANS